MKTTKKKKANQTTLMVRIIAGVLAAITVLTLGISIIGPSLEMNHGHSHETEITTENPVIEDHTDFDHAIEEGTISIVPEVEDHTGHNHP